MKANNGSRAMELATVVIDRDALRRLEDARSEGESVSDVIKRCVRPRQTVENVFRTMRQAAISPKTVRAIEDTATRRRQGAHKSKG